MISVLARLAGGVFTDASGGDLGFSLIILGVVAIVTLNSK